MTEHFEVDVRIDGARYFDVFRERAAAERWADDLWSTFGGSYFRGDTNMVRRREGALPWTHTETGPVREFDPTEQDPT